MSAPSFYSSLLLHSLSQKRSKAEWGPYKSKKRHLDALTADELTDELSDMWDAVPLAIRKFISFYTHAISLHNFIQLCNYYFSDKAYFLLPKSDIIHIAESVSLSNLTKMVDIAVGGV